MDSEATVALLTDRAVDAFGRIDLLVSTLGGAPYPLSFDAISEAQLLETFRLNTWPAVALIRAALAEASLGTVVRSSASRAARRTRPRRPWLPTRRRKLR